MNNDDCWSAVAVLIAKQRFNEAVSLCESERCSGLLECQRYLGWIYYQREDFDKAWAWFSKGAEREDGESLYGLGSVYFVNRNFRKALDNYQSAAKAGYSRAYHWIGYIYHQGLGVVPNVDLAIDYYKKGAACGYLIAERALLHLAWQRGSVLQRISLLPGYLSLAARTAVIAAKNIHDVRIVDVPHASLGETTVMQRK